jgi:hypothetical protein
MNDFARTMILTAHIALSAMAIASVAEAASPMTVKDTGSFPKASR